MIWVVGDLHGLCDPLKCLISELRKEERRGNPVEKIIFLGDLIDHGPSSKEVLEILRDLPWPAVTILGNHEQMMLDYLAGRPHWWFPGNGGDRTLESFGLPPLDPPSDQILKALAPEARWMETWPLVHQEKFTFGGRAVTWYFTHGGFSSRLPLEQHLEPGNYGEFCSWRDSREIALKETCLWSREKPFRVSGGSVVVSGHTPTALLHSLGVEMGTFDPAWGLPHFSFDGYVPRVHLETDSSILKWAGRMQDVHSIDMDTGAVYAGTLTALGISSAALEEGHFPVKMIASGGNYRNHEERSYSIKLLKA